MPKITDCDYIIAFEKVILPIANQFDPELVIISCGFDAMPKDPLGNMKLTPRVYHYMTKQLLNFAQYSLYRGKMVVALEGGYKMANLLAGSEAVVRALLGEDFNPSNYAKEL